MVHLRLGGAAVPDSATKAVDDREAPPKRIDPRRVKQGPVTPSDFAGISYTEPPKHVSLARGDDHLSKKPTRIEGLKIDVALTVNGPVHARNATPHSTPDPDAEVEIPEFPPLPSPKVFFIMGSDHPIRSTVLTILNHPWFGRAVLALIVLNCVFLVMADPLCRGHGSMENIPPNSTCNAEAFWCEEQELLRLPCDPPFCVGWKSIREGYKCNRLTQWANDRSELFFTALFTLEMLLKIVGYGLLLHNDAYLRSSWNWIDLIVVLLGWLGFVPNVANFSAARVFRVLRPLRTMNRVPGLKPLVASLFDAMKMLVNVLALFIFLFLLFGIAGVQLLGGKLSQRCVFSEGPLYLQPAEPVPLGTREILCSVDSLFGRQCPEVTPEGNYNQSYATHCSLTYSMTGDPNATVRFENPQFYQGLIHFDHVGWAFLTIFQIIAIEGFSDIWYHFEQAWNRYFARVYFCLLVLLGSWFIVNLALAVMSDSFGKSSAEENVRIQEEKEKNDLLLAERKAKEEAERKAKGIKTPKPTNKAMDEFDDEESGGLCGFNLKKICVFLASNQYFSLFVMCMIVVNVVFLALDYYDHSAYVANYCAVNTNPGYYVDTANCLRDEWGYASGVSYPGRCGALLQPDNEPAEILSISSFLDNTLQIANLALTSFFFLEMVIKIIAFGFKEYVKDHFNVFDMVIVFVSLIEIAIALSVSGGVAVFSVFRVLRLCRVFKLARNWNSLRQILLMLTASAKSIGPLLIVLCLFVFVYSLLGMQLFGGRFKHLWGHEPGSNPRSNFDGILPDTGPDSGYGAAVTVFQILTADNWNTVLYNGIRSTHAAAFLYFGSLIVFGNYIMMNLFVAVLLNGVSIDKPEDDPDVANEIEEMNRNMSKLRGLLIRHLPTVPENWKTRYRERQREKKARRALRADAKRNIYQLPDFEYKRSGVVKKTAKQRYEEKEAAKREEMEAQHRQENPWDKDYSIAVENAEEGTLVMPRQSSFFFLSRRSPVRRFCFFLITHPYFEGFILFCIITSSLLMAAENPALDEDHILLRVMKFLDIVFVGIFLCELILKVIALGFIAHPGSYMRDGWNVLDILIVIVSVLSVAMSDAKNLRALRFRVARVLRPLRVMKRNPGMKLVVNCLLQSIPAMMNVVVVCVMIFVTFAILAMQFFGGKFWRCAKQTTLIVPSWDPKYDITDMSTLEGFDDYTMLLAHIIQRTNLPVSDDTLKTYVDSTGTTRNITNWLECGEAYGVWTQDPLHFDHILKAIMVLFSVSTLDSWSYVMNLGLDSADLPGLPSERMLRPGMVIFFVFFLFIGSFVILNLFIGVVFENYCRLQQSAEGSIMTPAQKQWVTTTRAMMRTRPRRRVIPPKYRPRRMCFILVQHRYFEKFIMMVIFVNICIMGSKIFPLSPEHEALLEVTNVAFFVVYAVELVLKLVGLGYKEYFKHAWNWFDCAVVVASAAGLVPSLGGTTFIQVFRVIRIFRLVRVAKGLRQLMTILVFSVPSLINVGALLLLIVYVYAIVGVQLFWNVAFHGPISEQSNFEDFSNAFFMLFRVTTGQQWTAIMNECSLGVCKHCNPTWVKLDKCDTGCGGIVMAYLFFLSFVLLSVFVMLNLFIAIILDNFTQEMAGVDQSIGKKKIKEFAITWSEMDTEATLMLPATKLYAFLRRVDPPLGCGEHMSRKDVLSVIRQLDVPVYNGYFSYDDLFHSLCYSLCGVELPPAIAATQLKLRKRRAKKALRRAQLLDEEANQQLKQEEKEDEDEETEEKPTKNAYVLSSVVEAYAAMLIQSAWRGYKGGNRFSAFDFSDIAVLAKKTLSKNPMLPLPHEDDVSSDDDDVKAAHRVADLELQFKELETHMQQTVGEIVSDVDPIPPNDNIEEAVGEAIRSPGVASNYSRVSFPETVGEMESNPASPLQSPSLLSPTAHMSKLSPSTRRRRTHSGEAATPGSRPPQTPVSPCPSQATLSPLFEKQHRRKYSDVSVTAPTGIVEESLYASNGSQSSQTRAGLTRQDMLLELVETISDKPETQKSTTQPEEDFELEGVYGLHDSHTVVPYQPPMAGAGQLTAFEANMYYNTYTNIRQALDCTGCVRPETGGSETAMVHFTGKKKQIGRGFV